MKENNVTIICEIDRHWIGYMAGVRCWSNNCGATPAFGSWSNPPPSSHTAGLCISCLMKFYSVGGSWTPHWFERIKQFLNDNPELCLEI
jgi:hypothetical protein